MKQVMLCSMTIALTGLLVGCEEAPTATSEQVSSSHSYGSQAAPAAAYSQPTQFGSLPKRSDATQPVKSTHQASPVNQVNQAKSASQENQVEAASPVESVQGFPPGHPLHQEESVVHQPDDNALPVEQQAPQDHGDLYTEPAQQQEDSSGLPHTNINY